MFFDSETQQNMDNRMECEDMELEMDVDIHLYDFCHGHSTKRPRTQDGTQCRNFYNDLKPLLIFNTFL
jgi:hypothetical protein